MSDPKERPILMMGEMVRATLEDRKLQTRRVVKLREIQPSATPGHDWTFRDRRMLWNDVSTKRLLEMCPYGVPGDRLWVRETWKSLGSYPDNGQANIEYRAGGRSLGIRTEDWAKYLRPDSVWRPSIHMPRWASRIDLEVTAVRVERVQEISTTDAMAEGVAPAPATGIGPSYTRGFHRLWNAINAKPKPCYGRIEGKRVITHYESFPWEDNEETRVHRGKPWIVSGNPHVWVVEFKRVER